jgi:deoxyribose-phosphate aldolase
MRSLNEILNQPIEVNTDLVLELISYIDLTTLSDGDTDQSVLQLVDKANRGFNGIHPAAICTYSKFGNLVRKNLSPPMQTVVVGIGFPSGTTPSKDKIAHAIEIKASGAEELDIVLNHNDFFDSNFEQIAKEIREIKSALQNKHLKVILETGELGSTENIKTASEIACKAGADFIKTSTGKTPIGSTPTAVYEMCLVIADYYKQTGRKVGIKPSGGIRTFEDAALLQLIVKETLGKDWLSPSLFRIGASSLYDQLIEKFKEL